jgi:uncharacterized protein YbbK (DUF523 family)
MENLDIEVKLDESGLSGTQVIYDGSFWGIRIPGHGVAPAHFKAHVLILFSEQNSKGNV